ncbi:WG repeat-containing protein [Bacillus sp. JJ1566]|uniref:WG repeat-containing protein n=1 Tax=Bacillus sp. JJ1566 TaxID=3122961 RepID=UPI003F68AB11
MINGDFINKQGKVVIDQVFDSVTNFIEGIALVETNNCTYYIDKKGKMVGNKTYNRRSGTL